MAGLWLCLDPGGLCPLFFAAAAVHELGHLLCLRLCRVPVLRLRLSAAGAELETGPMPPRRALLCAAAGPGANLLAGAALLRCAPRFSLLCWMLAGFNLLPVWPLDGGRMLAALLPRQAEEIFNAGADVITMGNHTWGKRELVPYIDSTKGILRPANLPPQQPGIGWDTFDTLFGQVAVIDLIGRCAMDYTPDNPFLLVARILPKLHTKLIFVELHAEATSEKLALARYLTGRVSAVWGTHTHVATADCRILGGHTGFITDLGMVGSADGILGVKSEAVLHKFLVKTPVRFETEHGNEGATGALFTVDSGSGKCISAESVSF